MTPPNNYFFLSADKILVDGAKRSIILDLKAGKTYRVNASAKRILDLGEQGLCLGEAMERLSPVLSGPDVTSFLRELGNKGLVIFSPSPRPQGAEKSPSPRLDFVWLEITSRCNLRCIHCYAETEALEVKRQIGLSTEELEKVIEDAATLGCRKLQFTGGEPTLRADLCELIGYAKAKDFEFIEVFTNGNLLTEPMVKFLAESGINVAMSIYSYRADTHDVITGVPGSYERSMNSLKLLLAYGVPTRCEIVAMKQNEDDLDATSYFLSKLGVYNRPPDPVRPSGRGRGIENWPSKYGLKFMQTRPNFITSRESYEANRRWNSCWFGKAAVTSQGDVLPCVFAREQVVGNIKQQSLAEIISGENMLGLWGLTKDRVEVCRDCEYRYVCEDCRPWSYGFTGDLFAKSPRCTYDPYTGEWASPDGAINLAEGCVGKSIRKMDPKSETLKCVQGSYMRTPFKHTRCSTKP